MIVTSYSQYTINDFTRNNITVFIFVVIDRSVEEKEYWECEQTEKMQNRENKSKIWISTENLILLKFESIGIINVWKSFCWPALKRNVFIDLKKKK